MVKSAVQVYVRTRPTAQFAHDAIELDEAKGHIGLHIAKDIKKHYVNNQQDSWSFDFDHVMHNASQEVRSNTATVQLHSCC
jgi:kinesin family member 6/9